MVVLNYVHKYSEYVCAISFTIIFEPMGFRRVLSKNIVNPKRSIFKRVQLTTDATEREHRVYSVVDFCATCFTPCTLYTHAHAHMFGAHTQPVRQQCAHMANLCMVMTAFRRVHTERRTRDDTMMSLDLERDWPLINTQPTTRMPTVASGRPFPPTDVSRRSPAWPSRGQFRPAACGHLAVRARTSA